MDWGECVSVISCRPLPEILWKNTISPLNREDWGHLFNTVPIAVACARSAGLLSLQGEKIGLLFKLLKSFEGFRKQGQQKNIPVHCPPCFLPTPEALSWTMLPDKKYDTVTFQPISPEICWTHLCKFYFVMPLIFLHLLDTTCYAFTSWVH